MTSTTTVEAPAVVALRAGVQIVIESGFSVESGASFMAAIDPSLGMAETITFDYADYDYFLTPPPSKRCPSKRCHPPR